MCDSDSECTGWSVPLLFICNKIIFSLRLDSYSIDCVNSDGSNIHIFCFSLWISSIPR